MNNNNNGKGIFYGVIGVATLVVAIIGATFAYFAASTNSADNAVSAASSAVSDLRLTDVDDGIKSNLIPIDAVNKYKAKFPAVVGLTADSCKDDNHNHICSTYQFTVTNPNAQSQQVYFYLEPKNNTFTNLHYAIFKGTPTSYDVTGTVVTDGGAASNGAIVVANTQLTVGNTDRIPLDNLSQVLDPNEAVTYTIVLWVQETGGDQTKADSGKSFAGGVRISTGVLDPDGTATSGVTGILAA